jgi:hypothetical protein
VNGYFEIKVDDIELWRRCRYVGVIGDFAVEQPDFRAEPRRLLQFDFSFFDHTFVAVTDAWCPDFPSHYNASEPKKVYRLSAARDALLALDQGSPGTLPGQAGFASSS